MINANSSKSIYIEVYHDSILLSSATGFAVVKGKKYLITNWHVVSGRHFITNECLNKNCSLPNNLVVTFKAHDSDGLKWKKEKIELFDKDGNPNWIEHPVYKNKVDIVAIPFDIDCNNYHYDDYYPYTSNYGLVVTEPVFVIGFPYGLFIKNEDEPHAVWTSGTVASDPELNLNMEGEELPCFLIDSRTREGQSGSPIIYYSQIGVDPHYVNENGEHGIAHWGEPFQKAIAIYSGRINKESDLGYAWKWSVIKEILKTDK